MIFDIQEWLEELTKKLFDTFEGRIKFMVCKEATSVTKQQTQAMLM